MKISAVKATLFLEWHTFLHPYFPHLLYDCDDLQVMLLSTCFVKIGAGKTALS